MDKPKAYIWNGELFWAFEYEVIKEEGDDAEPLYTAPPKREWVGLATGEAREFYESDLSREELIHKIDEFLQEKNT